METRQIVGLIVLVAIVILLVYRLVPWGGTKTKTETKNPEEPKSK